MESDRYWLVTSGEEGTNEYGSMFYCSLYRCKTEKEAIDLHIKKHNLNRKEYTIASNNYPEDEDDSDEDSDDDKATICAHEIELNTAETV